MNKWVRKNLKLAKTLADDNDVCYSRKIGCVITAPDHSVISLGYNGCVSKIPHPDSNVYLAHFYGHVITKEEREQLNRKYKVRNLLEFICKLRNKKVCPRQMLDIKSGFKRWYCPCQCAERNALTNANKNGVSTLGATIYLYSQLACDDCTKAIIQAGIKKIVCLEAKEDYHPTSRWLLKKAGVEILEVDKKQFE